MQSFSWIIAINPADDYAQFGLGLAAAKVGDLNAAVEHLALAAAMRPDITHYSTALRGRRAPPCAANRRDRPGATPAGRARAAGAPATTWRCSTWTASSTSARPPIPGVPEALAAARTAGMRLAFVTNNASRTPGRGRRAC